jgi:hypothetical protein
MSVRTGLATLAAAGAVAAACAGGAWADSGTVTAVCGVGGQAQPPPCDSEWYTSPVSVVWNISGTPGQTPLGCQDAVYNTDQVTPLACAVSWVGGATTTLSFTLHIELSSPTATATPDRAPDVNGWYNHPVTVTLAGSAFSGVAVGACTAPQIYGGPATTSTALAGTCTDNAGKVASASFPFRYDATPPSLTVTSQPADRLAGLTWRASAGPAPLASVQIARHPGLERAASSVLYSGDETSYQDRQVRNGTAYTYTITATDQAGNITQRTVKVTPGIRLLSPASGARLKNPPTLRWTAIPKANYYNVQLFRGSKILSAWPTTANLKLSRSWRFGGKRHRLAPGRYHWYVWPGYGPQRNAHYGHAVGHATFVIR